MSDYKVCLIFKIVLITALSLFTPSFLYGQLGQLNKRIEESQKLAITNSVFKTAEAMTAKVNKQKKLRAKYLPIIDSLQKAFPHDTIFLLENYDFICMNCYAQYIAILSGNTYIALTYDYEAKKFIRENKMIVDNDDLPVDIQKIRKYANKGNDWYTKQAIYGTEDCFDGGQSFYTVLYPNGKILSMYMRCWFLF